jgi:signal transduction histidine kinase
MSLLKKLKLSGSNLLLIAICLLVIVSILLLNVVNSRNLISLQQSIDTLSSTNNTIETLHKTNEELLVAENKYRIFLSTGDTAYRNQFLNHINTTVAHLESIKNSKDSTRVNEILKSIDQKMKLASAIARLNFMEDSVAQNITNANVFNIYKKPLKVEKLNTTILRKYFVQQTDTIKAVKEKKTFFKKLGALFSNKDDTKYQLVKGDSSSKTAADSSAIKMEEMIGELSTEIQKFYEGVLNREIKYRRQLNEGERSLAETNLGIIDKINQASNTVIAREAAADALRDKGALVNAVNARKSIENISWASFAIILVIIVIMIFNILRTFRYEKNMVEAREKAEKLALTKTRFLNNMSHEIRSPLTSIIGFTEQIEKNEYDPEKRKYIQAIYSSSGHLMQTVNDILDYSKLDAGKMQLAVLPFRLEEVINEVVFASKINAEKKSIQLNLNSQINKDLKVLGDETRLRQILFNLIGNAVKFTDKGSVTVTASSLWKNNRDIVLKIEIIDTGIGIPADQLDMVFEEFAQASSNVADAKRTVKGTGLGLPICKMLAEMQGGNITVQSELHKGSLFTVNIPYTVAEDQTPPEKAAENSDSAYPNYYNKKVLVVEDNDMNIMLLTLLLKKYYMDFDIAKDGEKALELFKENKYDIILTDINVPKLTGDQLAVEIRKNEDEQKSKLPVVALTASIINDDLEMYMQCGIDEILIKPFKELEFANMLKRHLI